MGIDNFVSLSGIIPERPLFSQSANGVPVGEFPLKVVDRWTGKAGQECDRPLHFLCRATGYGANSIRKTWYPGVDVTIIGTLDQRTIPASVGKPGRTETFIRVCGLSYLSPRRVMEAQAS